MRRFSVALAICIICVAAISAFQNPLEPNAPPPPSQTGPGRQAVNPATLGEPITIDLNAQMQPFPHFWEQMFGSGRANLSLREEYRDDLRTVKKATDFHYLRFHAILDDENGVYDEDAQGRPVYNFSYVDQIYDGLLKNGVKPFVELSFMPSKLAANPAPHAFWYRPLPSPPKDPAKWSALLAAFTQHLVQRYGSDEVESWYFEVWNEPNLDFWDGSPKQATYFALYDESAKAIKQVDSKLRVGGPATAQAAWIPEFIDHCTKNKIPFDFVSTHVYGDDSPKDIFGTDTPVLRRDMVARAVKKVYDQVKASAAPNTPIIWSEYNATYRNLPDVTDTAFMGPWLANTIRESDGLATMMSYWTLSDVFEEQGVVKTPFYGGYGLIAERGIPKAAFHAFELLHQLGDKRFPLDSQNAIATKRADGKIVIVAWNYAEPGEKARPKTFRIDPKGWNVDQFSFQLLDPSSGSGLKAWQDAGSPVSPTLAQIDQLRKTSQMDKPITGLMRPIAITPQSLALIVLQPAPQAANVSAPPAR